MSADAIAAVLVVVALGSIIGLIAAEVRRWRATRRQARRAPVLSDVIAPAALAQPAPVQAPPAGICGTWRAVGGDRLELHASGVQIHLVARYGFAPYYLITPEGNTRAWGHDLAGLKRMGETIAAERAEFAAGLAAARQQTRAVLQRLARPRA